MRSFAVLSVATLLCSCGSIFDPAPYRPDLSGAALTFASPQDAAVKLQNLSDGYADARDSIMRQQLLFDIPILGLAAGTVASGIYGGSKDLTLGLGLGSASVAGGR